VLQHRVNIVARAKLTRRSDELGAYSVGDAHSEVFLPGVGFDGAFVADEFAAEDESDGLLLDVGDDASVAADADPDSAGAEAALVSAFSFAAVASRSAFFPSLP